MSSLEGMAEAYSNEAEQQDTDLLGGPSSPIPKELERIAALRSLGVDASLEAPFEHIVQLATALFDVPTSLISIVESDRQYFKARVGFEARETSREISFCSHALLGDDLLIIPDAAIDARFKNNPLVTGEPFIRFYAGAPLITRGGHGIGTICLIDRVPRPGLTSDQQVWLRSLARITMDHMERKQLNLTKVAALSLAGTTPDAIISADGHGRIVFWNAAAEAMFGMARAVAVTKTFSSLLTKSGQVLVQDHLVRARTDRNSKGAILKVRAVKADGNEFPAEVSLATWKDDGDWRFGAILRDISDREEEQGRLRYLTHYDPLTDLPNRTHFLECIEKNLRAGHAFSVLKIGLDRFKEINGSFGLAAGDLVLREVGERLRTVAGGDASVARLGSDEFGILWVGSDDLARANAVSEQVMAIVSLPFELGGATCHLGASVGIVLSPFLAKFEDAAAVLKSGLLALHHAKITGGRRTEVFREQLGDHADQRRRMEEELWIAFERNELELFFQPQVRLSDFTVSGAEALIRWRHPRRGLLSPAIFLPVLETSDLAEKVGEWILTDACSFAADLAKSGPPVRIGINLFASQLRSGKLDKVVARILQEHALPAELLELEITETTVLGLDESMVAPLRAVRDSGVGIAFDDYGTGYASLSLLKRYPITRLKVDREFVQNIDQNGADEAIVRAVLAMANSLGLDVIAEGIETSAQAAVLRRLGCSEAQGYLFGRPVPKPEFNALVQSRIKLASF